MAGANYRSRLWITLGNLWITLDSMGITSGKLAEKGRDHWRKILHGAVEKQAIPVDNSRFSVEKPGCFGENPAPFCGYSVQKAALAREIPVDKRRHFVDNPKKYVDKNQIPLDNQPVSPQISIETCGQA